MQISPVNYNTMYAQMYGTASTTGNQNTTAAVPDPSEENSASASNGITSFTSFMEQVKNGTVTGYDLAQMQKELASKAQSNPQQTQIGASVLSPMLMMTGSNSSTDDDSAADSTGSVSAAGASTVAGTSSSSDSTGSTDGLTLQSFLEKVKDGTVTQDDLTQMKNEIATMEQSGGTQKAHHHHHGGGAMISQILQGLDGSSTSDDSSTTGSVTGSTSTNGTSQVSGTSSADSVLSFLEDVKDGSVTTDELTQMQSLLQNWQPMDQTGLSNSASLSSQQAGQYDLNTMYDSIASPQVYSA